MIIIVMKKQLPNKGIVLQSTHCLFVGMASHFTVLVFHFICWLLVRYTPELITEEVLSKTDVNGHISLSES